MMNKESFQLRLFFPDPKPAVSDAGEILSQRIRGGILFFLLLLIILPAAWPDLLSQEPENRPAAESGPAASSDAKGGQEADKAPDNLSGRISGNMPDTTAERGTPLFDSVNADEKEDRLRFRYWMVPADRIDEWPWGEEKYYPVPGNDFQRWIQKFHQQADARNSEKSAPPLTELALSARYEEGGLVDGQAEARFTVDEPGIPFLFDPCSFSVTDFVWDDGEKASVGLYPDGNIYLAEPKNGTLRFRWSQSGTKNENGSAQFDLAFMESPAVSMTLDLPAGMRPSLSSGEVRLLDGAPEGFDRWILCPGIHSPVRLTVLPEQTAAPIQDKAGYQQEITCRLAEEGIDMVSRFVFDRRDIPEGDLTVILDQPLLPTSVEWVHPAKKLEKISRINSFGTTKLQIPLPENIADESLELKVGAFSPLHEGNHCRLPGIRLLSENTFWKETVLRLSVLRPLIAKGFETRESAWTFDRFADKIPGQESFTFKYFEPNAGLAVLFSEAVPKTVLDTSHEVTFEPQEIRVRSRLALTADSDGVMKQSFPLMPNWEIETVQEPGGAALNWSVIREEESRRLEVSFRHPIPADKTLILECTGRYVGEITNKMAVDSLVPIDLSYEPRGKHLAVFTTVPPYQTRWIDEEDQPAGPFTVEEPLIRELFPQVPPEMPIPLGNESSGVYVQLEKTSPTYSGTIRGTATVRNETLTEEWRIACTPPAGGRIDRVLVAFYDAGQPIPAEGDWTWNLVGETDRSFQIGRITEEERRGLGLSIRSRVWEVRLAASRSAPFEIQAVRTRPVRAGERLPLAQLPEVEQQTAEVTIASTNPIPPAVETQGVRNCTAVLPANGEYETALGGFSYTASELGSQHNEPEIRLTYRSTGTVQGTASAWCWFLRLDTLFEPDGIVRNYLSAFIENSGRGELTITLPEPLDADSIHAVWADSQRTTWYPETSGKRSAIRIVLPEKRRYVTIALEYYYNRAPLAVRQNLSPKMPELDVQVFSGDWNAWIPPEYAACTTPDDVHRYRPLRNKFPPLYTESAPKPFYQRLRALWPFGSSDEVDARRKQAAAFLERLGDPSVWDRLQSQKLVQLSQTPGVTIKPDSEKLTWGDLFTRPEVLAAFFPNQTEESPVQIYVNRTELARCRIQPDKPAPLPNGTTPMGGGLKFLEQSGLVLLMLRPDLIYVTSTRERMEFEENLIPLGSDWINMPPDSEQGEAIRQRLLKNNSQRIVSAKEWSGEGANLLNPWTFDPYSAGFPLIASGWNHYTLPLEDSVRGIEAINRYQLAVRKWLAFLAIAVLSWRGPLSKPSFLIGLLGISIALFGFLSPAASAVCCGGILGTISSLLFQFFRYRRCRVPVPSAEIPETIDESEPGFVPMDRIPQEPNEFLAPDLTHTAPAPAKGSSLMVHKNLKEEAAEIFSLDLREKKPANEEADGSVLQKLSEDITDEVTVLSNQTAETEKPPLPSTETDVTKKDSGMTRLQVLGVMAVLALLFGFLTAQTAVRGADSADSASEPEAVSGGETEPARIFVPYGEDRQADWNDYIWIPESFHQKLSDLFGPQETLENPWRLTQAFYEGTVNYNAFTQTLSLFHLKAVYTVVLETGRAMIRLPMMALPPDGGAKFDHQPIYPIFRQNELYFEITGSEPGEHTLELTLTPPLFEPGSESGVEISIPRIPDARLELKLPPDAPLIRVNGGHGTVRLGGDLLEVRLGPTDKIRLEREVEPGKIGSARVEVEQLFLLRARPNQTTLSARYRFRISDGKVQTLYFRNDPRYFLSQCSCDDPELTPSIQWGQYQDDETRVSFQKPVSGVVTLRADYVIREFSGIGQIRLPRIKASRARITRSWLALLESPTVEFIKTFPSDVAVGTFQNLWEGEETPLAVYDLTKPDPAWSASIRLAAPQQSVREQLSVLFDSAWTKLDYTADFRTDGDIFRLPFEVSDFFELDSVEITDDRGNPAAKPETHQESGHLYLFFGTPLSGGYHIRLSGRTRTEIGAEKYFPSLSMEGVTKETRQVEGYRNPRVLVRFKTNDGWTTEAPAGPPKEIDGQSVLFVGSRKNSSEAENTPSKIVVSRNLTKIGGEIRTILFSRSSDRWEILSDFMLNVESGAADHFEIDLDELCTGPITVEPKVPFQEVERPRGKRLIITPPKPAEGKFAFRIRTPIQSSAEMLRLPKISLSAPLGDHSGLVTRTYLPANDPLRQTRYRWETENMRLIDDPARRNNLEADMNLRPSAAVSALASAISGDAHSRNDDSFPAVISQVSSMTRDDFFVYEITDSAYSAYYLAGQNIPQIFGSASNFFIRRDGSLYGETVLDVRFFSSSAVEVKLSPQAVLQQVMLDGIPVPFEMLGSGQWRLELLPESAGRRLRILFYQPPDEKQPRRLPNPGNYTHLELVPAVLDGIESHQSYWTALFESDTPSGEKTPCRLVQTISGSSAEPNLLLTFPPVEESAYEPGNSLWKIPIPYNEALPVLTRLTFEKMKHLLDTLEWASADWTSDTADAQRWFSRWYVQWQQYRNEIRTQLAGKYPLSFTNKQCAAVSITDGQVPQPPDKAAAESVNAEKTAGKGKSRSEVLPGRFLMSEVSEQEYLELNARFERILQTAGLSIPPENTNAEPVPPSVFSIWQLNHSGTFSSVLVGRTDADLNKITLYRFNPVRHHLLQKGIIAILWLLATGLVLFAIRNRTFRSRAARWLDLTFFFAGIIWVIFRPGYTGWIIAVLALVYRVIRIRYTFRKTSSPAPRPPEEESSSESPIPGSSITPPERTE